MIKEYFYCLLNNHHELAEKNVLWCVHDRIINWRIFFFTYEIIVTDIIMDIMFWRIPDIGDVWNTSDDMCGKMYIIMLFLF